MKYIYALIDPRDRSVRYVGQTDNVERRYTEHKTRTEDTVKGLWIQELRSLGMQPGIAVLASAEGQEEINYLETWWILLGRRAGWDLRNGTNPGAWRVKEDFRALFADELARMYEEHKAACERLQAEVTVLAVERERLKWIGRAHWGIVSAVTISSLVGAFQFAWLSWHAPDRQAAFVGLMVVLLWLIFPVITYLYSIIVQSESGEPHDPGSFLFPAKYYYAVLIIACLAAGAMSFIELVKIFG